MCFWVINMGKFFTPLSTKIFGKTQLTDKEINTYLKEYKLLQNIFILFMIFILCYSLKMLYKIFIKINIK